MRESVAKKYNKQQTAILHGSLPFEPLARFSKFVLDNPFLTLSEFENATEKTLPLCGFLQTADLKTILDTLKKISLTMPHLIQIFRNPQTHLKELELILDVDLARRTTPKTVRHLIKHPEDWHSIKGGNITPKRVLTKQYEDDYSIYENIVFKCLIDKILMLLHKYALELERSNSVLSEMNSVVENLGANSHNSIHINLGKLYMAYYRTQDNVNISKAVVITNKLIKTITPYLSSPIYKNNLAAKPLNGKIKLTHKLAMHKDYKYIYLLYNYLNTQTTTDLDTNEFVIYVKQKQLAFEHFCSLLTIFACTANNFTTSEETVIYNKGKLSTTLKNNSCTWQIKQKQLLNCNITAIELKIINSKKKLSYLLLPKAIPTKSSVLEDIHTKISVANKNKYTKIIFLTNYKPKTTTILNVPYLPIMLADVHSFIRIQNLLKPKENSYEKQN